MDVDKEFLFLNNNRIVQGFLRAFLDGRLQCFCFQSLMFARVVIINNVSLFFSKSFLYCSYLLGQNNLSSNICLSFSILSSSLNQIEQLLCDWTCKLNACKCFFNAQKLKRETQNIPKENEGLFALVFLKKWLLIPLYFSVLYLHHFLFDLSHLKHDGCPQ